MVAASHLTDAHFDQRDSFMQLSELLGKQFARHHRRVSDDHWLFEVPTGRRRTQLVHFTLDHKPASRGEDTRPRVAVLSPVGPVPARLPAEMLLRRNAKLNAGAICIVDLINGGQRTSDYLAVRATHLLSADDFGELYELLSDVASAADELEREFFAHDEL